MRRLTLITTIVTAALAAVQAHGQDRVDFARDVLPFLRNKCFSCHAAPENGGKKKEPKGGLRLDGKDWILRGGDGEDAVVANDLEASGIYRRVALPADDPDFMPSKGDGLTEAEHETLRTWIEQGADFGDWTGAAATPGEAKPTAPVVVPASQLRLEKLAEGMTPVAASTLARAAGEQAQIEPVHPGSPLLRVSFHAAQAEIDDRRFGEFAKLAPRITHLDLSRTKVTDRGLALLGRMTKLTRLDLSRTGITDRGLAQLRKADNLHSLNLFGTRVSDAGLKQLAKLTSLRKLYVWQTRVSADGVTELQQTLPELEVVLRPVWPKPAAPRDAGQRRRRR